MAPLLLLPGSHTMGWPTPLTPATSPISPSCTRKQGHRPPLQGTTGPARRPAQTGRGPKPGSRNLPVLGHLSPILPTRHNTHWNSRRLPASTSSHLGPGLPGPASAAPPQTATPSRSSRQHHLPLGLPLGPNITLDRSRQRPTPFSSLPARPGRPRGSQS